MQQQQPQQQAGSYTDDQKMGSLIEEGLNGQIALIGFPHDIGSERDQVRSGQENGPDSLRRFFKKTGPVVNSEYNINIGHLKISDYGNIFVQEKEAQLLEDLLEKLKNKMQSVYSKGNIPIILGGSKDCSLPAYQALIEKQEKPSIISIIPAYDLKRLYDQTKVSINSGMNKLFTDNQESIKQSQLIIHYFGIQEHLITQEDQQFIKNFASIITTTHLSDIRKQKVNLNDDILEPITQGGILFKQVLGTIVNAGKKNIHLSLSLEAINSAFCPGVSRQSTTGGLTAEEIVEIMLLSGRTPQICSVDITDYNPSKEDYRTGLLFSNLIYYFAMGLSKRLQQKQQ